MYHYCTLFLLLCIASVLYLCFTYFSSILFIRLEWNRVCIAQLILGVRVQLLTKEKKGRLL